MNNVNGPQIAFYLVAPTRGFSCCKQRSVENSLGFDMADCRHGCGFAEVTRWRRTGQARLPELFSGAAGTKLCCCSSTVATATGRTRWVNQSLKVSRHVMSCYSRCSQIFRLRS